LVQINWQHYTLYFLWLKSTDNIIHCIFFGWNQLTALYIVFSLVQRDYTLYSITSCYCFSFHSRAKEFINTRNRIIGIPPTRGWRSGILRIIFLLIT
jgi:hypothetical protein